MTFFIFNKFCIFLFLFFAHISFIFQILLQHQLSDTFLVSFAVRLFIVAACSVNVLCCPHKGHAESK